MSTNSELSREDRLWDYIDGRCSAGERSAIEALLANNSEWKREYNELQGVNELLDASELEMPSLRFTKNVMEEIARHHVAPATRNYINKNVIRGIMAFFLTLIVGFLGFTLFLVKSTAQSGGGSTSGGSTLKMPEVSANLDPQLDKYGNSFMAFNGTYLIVFVLISVIMGFVLLDFYLQRKKQQSSRGA